MNIAQRITEERRRQAEAIEAMLELSATDPWGWGVRVDEGPGLFDFAIRLDPDVPAGHLDRHHH